MRMLRKVFLSLKSDRCAGCLYYHPWNDFEETLDPDIILSTIITKFIVKANNINALNVGQILNIKNWLAYHFGAMHFPIKQVPRNMRTLLLCNNDFYANPHHKFLNSR